MWVSKKELGRMKESIADLQLEVDILRRSSIEGNLPQYDYMDYKLHQRFTLTNPRRLYISKSAKKLINEMKSYKYPTPIIIPKKGRTWTPEQRKAQSRKLKRAWKKKKENQ